jgi:hypothetical protein
MANPVNLPRLDAPPIDYDKLSPELKRWLANLVDVYNEAMTQIENA